MQCQPLPTSSFKPSTRRTNGTASVMEPIESKELRDSLLDAVSALTTACEYAATRYGARVTLALLSAANKQP